MSIDRVSISSQGIDRSQATQGNESMRKAEKDKERNVLSGLDSVALSPQAKEMDRLASAVENSRSERLNEVRQALEAGSYRVSAKALAEMLIDANRKE